MICHACQVEMLTNSDVNNFVPKIGEIGFWCIWKMSGNSFSSWNMGPTFYMVCLYFLFSMCFFVLRCFFFFKLKGQSGGWWGGWSHWMSWLVGLLYASCLWLLLSNESSLCFDRMWAIIQSCVSFRGSISLPIKKVLMFYNL